MKLYVVFLSAAFASISVDPHLLAQVTSTPTVIAPVTPTPSQTVPAVWKLTAEPSTVQAGKDYVVLLKLATANCPSGSKPFDAVESILPSSSSDLKVGKNTPIAGDDCTLAVPVSVTSTALGGNVSLLLEPKTAGSATLGVVSLKIQSPNPLPAGPIAPGLAPQLDIMWKILPRQAVADSYGSRVADGFFAVEATFGNETGYDLQVAALGFMPPEVECVPINTAEQTKPNTPFDYFPCRRQMETSTDPNVAPKEVKGHLKFTPRPQSDTTNPILPVDSYPIVRGTVEREQFVGTRAIVVNLVKAAGPILVGVGGAFYGASDSFNLASEIFSSPFEKGLELVYPDLTTSHLINLDNRTLRDGAVIPNNTAMRINAFISRELVQCGFPKRWYKPFETRGSRSHWQCEDGDTRLQYAQNFDPNDIMERLGRIALIGQQIQYINRVRVVQGDPKATAIAGPLVTGNVLAIKKDTPSDLAFAGINLQGATIVPGSSGGLVITNQTASSDGSSLTFHADATQSTADSYEVQIVTHYGSTPATLQIVKSATVAHP